MPLTMWSTSTSAASLNHPTPSHPPPPPRLPPPLPAPQSAAVLPAPFVDSGYSLQRSLHPERVHCPAGTSFLAVPPSVSVEGLLPLASTPRGRASPRLLLTLPLVSLSCSVPQPSLLNVAPSIRHQLPPHVSLPRGLAITLPRRLAVSVGTMTSRS